MISHQILAFNRELSRLIVPLMMCKIVKVINHFLNPVYGGRRYFQVNLAAKYITNYSIHVNFS